MVILNLDSESTKDVIGEDQKLESVTEESKITYPKNTKMKKCFTPQINQLAGKKKVALLAPQEGKCFNLCCADIETLL